MQEEIQALVLVMEVLVVVVMVLRNTLDFFDMLMGPHRNPTWVGLIGLFCKHEKSKESTAESA